MAGAHAGPLGRRAGRMPRLRREAGETRDTVSQGSCCHETSEDQNCAKQRCEAEEAEPHHPAQSKVAPSRRDHRPSRRAAAESQPRHLEQSRRPGTGRGAAELASVQPQESHGQLVHEECRKPACSKLEMTRCELASAMCARGAHSP
jgi:hypothetical protein